ncbi:electron transfer flavoprotein-quinone oxidoreductase [Tamaricihabitans halophyticus]|uniref:Electron transfer flavoprotein-quinone oxidoreductase n=1 Tax=Tamaricihabitans halophyticus TaxID=1262583 RepID=A0A4R2QYK4_9PSEU|nr:FAD-dependent oxidoreductase [Tamaricihabitans halophyticus]TCP54128.1 electron transfer flavoprotein-quinone oxidoreductase [Tamaricihabitans halophyticus]
MTSPMSSPVRVAEGERGVASFDAVIVGAGPAGSAAAIELARAGRRVALLERGSFPGAKNVYGGVVYGRVLDELIPNWWTEAPIQRWVTRRQTMLLTPGQALTVDFRTENWGKPPYNGATTHRADFDAWLAGKAEEAGAKLLTSTLVTALRTDPGGRIVGVRTDRPDGDLDAGVVIAADGVNSFLAKQAGLYAEDQLANSTLGVKETLALPRETIEERFGVRGTDGVDIEMIGATKGIPGGGFLYTNLDSLSIGVVVDLTELGKAKVRPEELIAELKRHPSIAPLVRGGEIVEYAAHLIPEGGYHSMPTLTGNGLLIAGDAAAMCLAAGIWLEGVNFAIGSGMYAGRAAAAALAAGDTSTRGLAGYRERLASSFVLADHHKLRGAPGLLMSERVQRKYPAMLCDLVEGVFQVTNPQPKPGFRKLLLRSAKRHGVRLRDLARDAISGIRSYG